MSKRFFAFVLAMVMLMFTIPMPTLAMGERAFDLLKERCIATSSEGQVTASIEVEGIVISCKYLKNTNEYFLYLEDEEYKLDVVSDADIILFDIHTDSKINEQQVYGQNPAILAMDALAPEVITAIESCLMSVVATMGFAGITYVSMDLCDTLLKSETITTIDLDVVDVAISVFEPTSARRTKYDDVYFEASIQVDNTIFIGQLLTYKQALFRLRLGYDIFATDSKKACFLAQVASPIQRTKGPEIHKGKGDRYLHRCL